MTPIVQATVTLTAFVALLCAGFIVWDHLRRVAFARLAATFLALGLLFFAEPKPYRALRHAAFVPPEERVEFNFWVPSKPATEFESGVFTLYEYILDDLRIDRQERLLGIAILTALALTPIFRRVPTPHPRDSAAERRADRRVRSGI